MDSIDIIATIFVVVAVVGLFVSLTYPILPPLVCALIVYVLISALFIQAVGLSDATSMVLGGVFALPAFCVLEYRWMNFLDEKGWLP